jgi:2-alkenal reductase
LPSALPVIATFTPSPALLAVPTVTRLSAPLVDLVSSQETLVRLYEQASPGVVAIRVLTPNGSSLGSGFVSDLQGHIVTNYHVIEDQTEVQIAFSSGFKVRGTVVGVDQDSDLAVIQVDAPVTELHPIPLGDSDQVKIGQIVVAIGNPFGLEGTLTLGVVSGLGRTFRSSASTIGPYIVGDVIQTDTAINPGNSGGPLLNLAGEVIGINTLIITRGGQAVNSGVGFAVSVNMVKKIVPALIDTGKFVYPYLGIYSLDELTLTEQEVLGLPRSTGVYVTKVEPGGPAEQAGIQAGDVTSRLSGVPMGGDLIIAVNGYPVLDFNDLIVYITRNQQPGDQITLTILRGGEQIDVMLTLGARPEQ